MSGLIGITSGFEEIGERWVEQIIEEGLESAGIEGLSEHLGRKQQLEVVESNNLVREFCRVTRLLGG